MSLNWGEFKKQVELQNVNDESALHWIDTGSFWRDEDELPPIILVKKNERGEVEITGR